LVNGSIGIAVGMATNIPPHNLREISQAAQFVLKNPNVVGEELIEELIKVVKGPDFPTGAQILGRRGIEDAYRTGRGSITMRAVVNVEELHNRTCLVVTELPYQVNPDNLALKIAELVKEGKLTGIADIRDETSGRTGQRLVIVLKKDAVARVVLNNLYKYTQLQENFGANMLALVDGVPRTLSIDGFITNWVAHQVEVIVRRTKFRLRKAEERAHILRGYLKALDALDEVIALIRKSATVDDARDGLMKLLSIDELQARAILNMQLRQLAALERQKIIDEAAELERQIAEFQRIIADEAVQRQIISDELEEVVSRYGDDRRSEILLGFDGDVSMEDLIPEEEMVVTLTAGGYIKRTRSDNYRVQHRGGKGVKGASLRADDVVQNFIVSTTHHWLMFFTNTGRVFRSKVYEIQESGRDAKGQHVANLLALQPEERIVEVLDLKDYQQAPYLVLATRAGLVKKTALEAYDTARTGGIIAIKLREGDELVNAMLVSDENDLLLVSRKGMSIRFSASSDQLRPMGRDTSGVMGMSFRKGDELLSATVIGEAGFVFVVTEGGYAKRTSADQYRIQNRGGLGIKVAKLDEKRGDLVGALIVDEADEVLVVLASGKVIRTNAAEVPAKGRDTMGVVFARFEESDSVLSLARNTERNLETNDSVDVEGEPDGEAVQAE
jgi:DNA gyrase subunit A